MLRAFLLLCGLSVMVGSADAAVQSKKVTYKHGNTDCFGYLAWDDAIEGLRPGVLVVHEFWGLDAYAKRRADQLAKLDCPFIFTTGYGKAGVPEGHAGRPFVQKPFRMDEIAQALAAVLEAKTA